MIPALAGCFGLDYGDGTPNDPLPSGSILAQGELLPQGSADVGGTAVVYAGTGGGFIFRLSGLTAPAETGQDLRAVTNTGTVVSIGSLRAYSGNQNYFLSYPPVSWSQLLLWSTQTNQAYGLAILR
jgi:hypothetical protein